MCGAFKMQESNPTWWLNGDCAEACTSPAVCPYYWGSSAPRELHDGKDQCEGVFAFLIRSGKYDEINLAGLKAAFGFNTGTGGASMAEHWKAILYLDDTASDDQLRCLETVFRACWSLAGHIVKVKKLSITFVKEKVGTVEKTGFRHTVELQGVFRMKAEPILSRDGTARFISGMSNGTIYVGRTVENRFKDTDLPRSSWDRPGMSNTYFQFNISPSKLEWVP
jgi:hypothetical protein